MAEPLPEEGRKELFAALVAAQDGGLGVAASRKKVAAEYGLTPKQVEEIEREGLDAQWPPLGSERSSSGPRSVHRLPRPPQSVHDGEQVCAGPRA